MSLTAPWRPIVVLARTTFLGTARSWRGIGLALLAFLPAFVMGGLAADGVSSSSLVGIYESLVFALFFPLVLLLVSLLLAVPLFRDEIDEQSISYLITRTLGKPAIVLGKYLGYVLLALLLLVPSLLVTYGIVAAGAGSSASALSGVLPAVLLATLLGILAYGAFYLFLGLVTRRALLIGLIYAFVWEYLILITGISGDVPDLTVMHYLLSIPKLWVASVPFSTYSSNLSLSAAVGVPLGFAFVLLLLGILVLRYLPLSPSPE